MRNIKLSSIFKDALQKLEQQIKSGILIVALILIVAGLSIVAMEGVDAPADDVTSASYLAEIDNDYFIKPGDFFFISIIGAESKEIYGAVNVTGELLLHPVTAPLQVAGMSLKDAKQMITDELIKYFRDVEINVVLHDLSPQRIHFLGAVNKPGEYVVDSLATLQQGLRKAGGLSPAASKKIKIVRRGETRNYNLNDYILYGKTEENPLLYNDDIVLVSFAESFCKLYVVTDSVNYVEYFEIEEGETKQLRLLLKSIRHKYRHSDYKELAVMNGDDMQKVDDSYQVKPGDRVYLKSEESYIYVRGNVNMPGRFTFVPGKLPHYYISHAGGVGRDGSTGKIVIVKKDGQRVKYKGQELNEGDTIIVPLSMRAFINDYLAPISAVLSVVTTIVVLTR